MAYPKPAGGHEGLSFRLPRSNLHASYAIFEPDEIYLKIAHLPTITDNQMHQLERRFGVNAREGYLK